LKLFFPFLLKLAAGSKMTDRLCIIIIIKNFVYNSIRFYCFRTLIIVFKTTRGTKKLYVAIPSTNLMRFDYTSQASFWRFYHTIIKSRLSFRPLLYVSTVIIVIIIIIIILWNNIVLSTNTLRTHEIIIIHNITLINTTKNDVTYSIIIDCYTVYTLSFYNLT